MRFTYRKEPCSITAFSILVCEHNGEELMRSQVRDEVINDLINPLSVSDAGERERRAFEVGMVVGLESTQIPSHEKAVKYCHEQKAKYFSSQSPPREGE